MVLDGSEVSGLTYTLNDTPCENVKEKGFCYFPDHARELFPHAKDLRDLNIRGYAGTPLWNSRGEVIGILCTLFRRPLEPVPMLKEVMEIIAVKAAAEIERERSGKALRQSEERFRSFVENITEIVFSVDTHGTFTYFSPNLKELTGYETHEAVGRTAADFVHPDDLPAVRQAFYQVVRKEQKTAPVEYRIRYRDGSWHWYIQNISPVLDDDGQVIAIQGIAHDITKRKQAEEALLESEEKFRSLVETSPDMIWEIDPAGNFRYISPRIRDIMGYTPDEVIGKSITSLLPREIHAVALGEMARHFQSDLPINTLEIPARHKNGQDIIVEIRSARLQDATGTVAGFRGVTSDVTARRKAENALRESEEKYRSIVETSPDIIWEIGLDGTFTYISPTIERVLGYSPDEIIGKKTTDLMPEEARPAVDKVARDHQQPGWDFKPIIIPARHRDGRGLFLELRPARLTGPDGSLIGFRGVAIDITERQQAEDAIRKSREKLGEAMDIAHLVNWECDIRTGLFTFDDRFYELYGTTREQEGGFQMPVETYVREFVHSEDIPLVEQVLRGVPEITDPEYRDEVEHRIIRRDGEVRFILVRVRVTMGQDGRVMTAHGASQDITERKRAEEAISAANNKLLLLSSITRHDILNQVTALSAYLELLAMTHQEPDAADHLHAMEKGLEVIRLQLEFARDYQEIGLKKPGWHAIRAEFSSIVESFAGNTVHGTCSCNGEEVFSDPMIGRVFYNLIDNSLRHGDHVTDIRLSVQPDGQDLIIVYEDNGRGISFEDKEKIFLKGFGQHTGLGMFLIREILSITGMSITECGEPGKGARFEIHVPDGAWRVPERRE
ncbi:MAG: PAS domain S-box protein [Methanomicrobiales archaeon]|nr:PAS domain S-box protein [Methanomicrobiales archaeon]